jgi:hypothetical protein
MAICRSLSLFLLFLTVGAAAQSQGSYKDFIFNNQAISWAAEYESFVNLTPKTNTFSLKKWWIAKLKNEAVPAYNISADGNIVKTQSVHLPGLMQSAWFNDYYVQPSNTAKAWRFVNRKTSESLRVVPEYSNDSCCGCDDSEAFRVKQLLTYSHSRFSITNVLLSPLCARKKEDKIAWYPLGNFSLNTKPARTATAKYITTSEVSYNVNQLDSMVDFKTLSVGDQSIVNHLFNDVSKGILKATDPQTKEQIPKDALLTWRMPADTVADYNQNGEVVAYRVTHQEFDPKDLTVMRILQDWYFDTNTQKIYSEARSVLLLRRMVSRDGEFRGITPAYLIAFPVPK